jgi:hypothetical protein
MPSVATSPVTPVPPVEVTPAPVAPVADAPAIEMPAVNNQANVLVNPSTDSSVMDVLDETPTQVQDVQDINISIPITEKKE